jgi:phosphoribosyl-AMP cyclohydrolase
MAVLRKFMKSWFKQIESSEDGTRFAAAKVLGELTFDHQGLIPVVAQDAENGDILMFAWMNQDALHETIATGRMCYWSRSRKSLWRKGETSGHWQTLHELRTDCDGDVILAKISQEGAACHTLRHSCFYLRLDGDDFVISQK